MVQAPYMYPFGFIWVYLSENCVAASCRDLCNYQSCQKVAMPCSDCSSCGNDVGLFALVETYEENLNWTCLITS